MKYRKNIDSVRPTCIAIVQATAAYRPGEASCMQLCPKADISQRSWLRKAVYYTTIDSITPFQRCPAVVYSVTIALQHFPKSGFRRSKIPMCVPSPCVWAVFVRWELFLLAWARSCGLVLSLSTLIFALSLA